MKKWAYPLLQLLMFFVLFIQGLYLVFAYEVPQTIYPWRSTKIPISLNDPELRLFGMDWFPPQISILKKDKTLSFVSTEFLIYSDEEISVSGIPAEWTMENIQVGDELIYLLLTDNIPDGSYSYELVFSDSSYNFTESTLNITAPGGRIAVPSWENSEYTTNPDSYTALANKQYRLPEDYEPQDLVALTDLGIRNVASIQIRREAGEHLKQMVDAIAAAGIDYTVTSAYRSFLKQYEAYKFWVDFNNGDVATADTVSARPGHSEHQLGTTVDFVTADSGNTFFGFESTALAAWLADNAHNFGFVLSYPQGKQDITGYTYEPWHYRFVGVERALEVKASGLTLTEWLLKNQ